MPPDRYLSPTAVARRLGVRDATVYAWLKSGAMRGVNVAKSISARPRFRVSPEALVEFEASRSAAVAVPSNRRAPRKENVIEFY